MWLKNKIDRYRIERREERLYKAFLTRGTNVALKDNINALFQERQVPLCVLGNGDSLCESIQSLSKDNDYMVLNGAVHSPFYFELKPKYYSLADPGFFYENKAFDGPSVVRKILEETTWPMILFIPGGNPKMTSWVQSTEYVTVLPVNRSFYFGPEKYREYCYEHNLAMPNVQNVLVACIYQAIHLGYKTIELYGFEHSWSKSLYVGDDNHVYLRDSHFYETDVKDTLQVRTNGKPFKFHEMLLDYAGMFAAYWEIRNYADKKHVRIINYTPSSFIDAFERGVKKD